MIQFNKKININNIRDNFFILSKNQINRIKKKFIS